MTEDKSFLRLKNVVQIFLLKLVIVAVPLSGLDSIEDRHFVFPNFQSNGRRFVVHDKIFL